MVTRRKLWVSVSLRVIIRKANIFSSRDSPTRFSTSGFFHHSNQSGPLTNRLKYFRLLLRIGWVIQILSSKIWLPGVWYSGESVSRGYHTQASQSPRSIIPQRVNKKSAKIWLAGIWYPGKSFSPGYDTPASYFFYTKVQISQRNLN